MVADNGNDIRLIKEYDFESTEIAIPSSFDLFCLFQMREEKVFLYMTYYLYY